MDIEVQKETKLENAKVDEVPAILDYKLKETTPEGVVDYIGFAIDSIDDKIERIKDAQARLTMLKKDLDEQKDIIKIGGAKWLEEAGLDKLKGLIVSSITINKPVPSQQLVIDNKEALINAGYFKQSVDNTAVKKAINEGVKIEGAHIEIIHKENVLKINKGRK